MEEIILADKYAKALIRVAEDKGIVDQLEIELTMFAAILSKQKKLGIILRSPVIAFAEKKTLLETAFKKNWISEELKNFFYLLLKVGRFYLFKEINRIYQDLIDSLRKRVKVLVESAFALSRKEERALTNKLTQLYRREIDLFVQVCPALIGGAKVYVGHKLYDASMQNGLSLLKDSMKGA